MKFKPSALAKKYCVGKGIELGAAAHNPFDLPECINVAPREHEEYYKNHQVEMCGEFREIDIHAHAENLPFDDDSHDYIISSHVVEHIPDLIGAFLEWRRILKPGGIVFIIFPKKNALPSDVGRPLSTIDGFNFAHLEPLTRAINERMTDNHIWVFSLQSMVDLINHCNHAYGLGWEIIESHETDDKVGNGHAVVCRCVK
jgi:ubiquinone/menaquinone biosynthesis C-methylase UbiE